MGVTALCRWYVGADTVYPLQVRPGCGVRCGVVVDVELRGCGHDSTVRV